MKLRLLLAILFVSSIFVLTGCSSSEDDAESTEEVAAEETSETASELDPADSESGEETASTEESEESLDGEEIAEEEPAEEEATADLGEEGTEEKTEEVAAADKTEETDELDDLEDADFGDGSDTEDVAAADTPAETPAVEEPPAPETDLTASTDDAPVEDTVASDDTGAVMEKTWIPVKKVKDVPFDKNGVLANTVYLARPGDDLAAISQKVYGEDRTGELTKVNPNLAGGVKVGDKVYYNSPSRPTDRDKMLTYYEDKGVVAQTYVAKAGDNIRTVSKELLGDENSWKEVWASNIGVESKDVMPEGTELRYWTSDAGAVEAPVVAEAAAPVPDPALAPPPPPPVQAAAPPPAMPDANMPPPMPDQMANGGMPGTVGNEPPPPPAGLKKRPGKDIASAGADKNMKFMMLAGVVVVVGMVIILAARKKSNARKMSINAHTQV